MFLNADKVGGSSRRNDPHVARVFDPRMRMMVRSIRGGSSGTRLYLSNLDSGVTDRDIEILFSEVGQLISRSVHYYKNGQPKGTADVVYVHQSDAVAAKERYDDSPLDGKRLRIQFVGGVHEPLVPAIVPPIIFTGHSYDEHVAQGGIFGGEGQYGSLADRRKNRDEKLTKEELDADLEIYRQEALKRR